MAITLKPGDEEFKEEKATRKIQVKLLYGYYPEDPDHPRHPRTGDAMKVLPGEIISLPVEEARNLVKAGRAHRADEIE